MTRQPMPHHAPRRTTRLRSGAPVAAGTPLSLAPAMRRLSLSPTLAINEAVAARRAVGQVVIHLGFGEAAFPLHPLLRAALAGSATATSYPAVLGIPRLREAIAGYLNRERGLAYEAAQIAVAPGSKPLLYALMQALAGDVLLPVPSWVSYAPHAQLAGKWVIPVATDPADFHRLTPQALAAAAARARHDGADPRILVVNTPSNPTGGMFARADVEALAAWARGAGVTILSDEIYAELAHGWRPHVSPAEFYPEGTIVTGGLSKGFSAGGWRLGYAALPGGAAGRELLSAVRALASEIWSGAAAPIQEAAVVAYGPDADLALYRRRAARVFGHATGRLQEALVRNGVRAAKPAGAFYLYADFAPFAEALRARGVETGMELARRLLDEHGIATLPGIAFGDAPEALRLRLATSLLCAQDMALRPLPEDHLWPLLESADSLPADDPAAGAPLPLPAIDRAIEALDDFVGGLGAASGES